MLSKGFLLSISDQYPQAMDSFTQPNFVRGASKMFCACKDVFLLAKLDYILSACCSTCLLRVIEWMKRLTRLSDTY